MYFPRAICSGVPSTLMFGGNRGGRVHLDQADAGDDSDGAEDQRQQAGADAAGDLHPQLPGADGPVGQPAEEDGEADDQEEDEDVG
jgi:hypothetical protein